MSESKNKRGGLALFADLVILLGTSTKTNDKLDALSEYFASAEDADKVWVIALFSGRKPKRTVNSTQLSTWCTELTGLPQWLFEESYHTAGDLAETIALLLPEPGQEPRGLEAEPAADPEPVATVHEPVPAPGMAAVSAEGPRVGQEIANVSAPPASALSWYLEKLTELSKEEEPIKKAFILSCWKTTSREERFVFNKLITGGFRIGVSQKMIVNALSRVVKVSSSVIAHRISGNWDPSHISFEALLSEESVGLDISRPYPFYLAYALEESPDFLGDPGSWQAEWKWDGIRGQLVKRGGQLFVWSRGEEIMTDKFPEYQGFGHLLPDGTVLDGEIIGLELTDRSATTETLAPDGPGAVEENLLADFKPLPFAALQTRIGRKNVTKKQLTEAPVGFIAYDLLESGGADWRNKPLYERRGMLEDIIRSAPHPLLKLSPAIQFLKWQDLTDWRIRSREIGSEGIMLKKKDSIYQVGRKRGDWWKWKIDPLVIDAVMVYAQKGHGRRSNLYTDYTFAVKDGDKLVTFTKAYSGLTDKELAEVDAFVKRNSLEKFGPVRTVKPELVFEIAFEGIAASGRHKSGVALRFPRINRWRKDKSANEIDTLDNLKKILAIYK